MAPLAFQKTRKQGVIWVCRGIRGPSADAIGMGPTKVERVCTVRPIHAPIIKPSRRHSPRPQAWIFQYGQDVRRETE